MFDDHLPFQLRSDFSPTASPPTIFAYVSCPQPTGRCPPPSLLPLHDSHPLSPPPTHHQHHHHHHHHHNHHPTTTTTTTTTIIIIITVASPPTPQLPPLHPPSLPNMRHGGLLVLPVATSGCQFSCAPATLKRQRRQLPVFHEFPMNFALKCLGSPKQRPVRLFHGMCAQPRATRSKRLHSAVV
jgi:hypothetical protein